MDALTLVNMALTALMVATLPAAMVWMSSDANKYRKLAWTCVFLIFDLIVFGGFTRLTDSGLGCPDWPGCYGTANPFLAHDAIRHAESLLPTGPVTMSKAWIEMIHRYLAMAIGVLIIAMVAQSWRLWRKERRADYAPLLPTALLGFYCLQGVFGALTVTQKLQPIIVTGHLLLAMGLLSLTTWFASRQDTLHAPARVSTGSPPAMRNIRWLAVASGALLLVQLALGGWVSTNYAALACGDFPLCGGQLLPAMDMEQGFTLWRALGRNADGTYLSFPALTAIHWVHRNFAFIVALVTGYTAWRAWEHAGLHKISRNIAIVLAVQLCTGIATIFLNHPLALAVLHNAGAALLVLLLTMLNYRAKYQFEIAQKAAASAVFPHTAPARHH